MSESEASINCPDCGGKNDPESSFCGLCGAPIERVPAEATGSTATEDLGGAPESTEKMGGNRIGGLVLGDEIARGGMGVIYEAFDENLDRRVAVKVISPDLAGDVRFRKRFIAETRAVASLHNPFILPVYQAGDEGGTLFLITKLVNGGDLASALRERGTFSPEETALVVSQIADALGAAHEKGMIHRDVKPANILADDDSGAAHYYLADFGLTKYGVETSGITNTGEVLGTVDYMAPEQIEGGAIDERADIYALGCLAAELLSGRPPFRRDSKQATLIAHLNDEPEIPNGAQLGRSAGLQGVLQKALAKNPDSRYQTCSEFSENFAAAIGQGALAASADATEVIDPPTVPPGKKSRAGLIATGLAALVLLAGGGGYVLAGGTPFGDEAPSNEVPETPPDTPPDETPPDTPPDETPVDTPPEPAVETTKLESLAEEDTAKITSDDLGVYTAAYWAGDDDLPQIGDQPYRDAVVLEGYNLDKQQSEAQLPLTGYSSFSAIAGAESTMPDQRVLRLEVQVTGSDGNRRSVWERNLKTGAKPAKIEINFQTGDSQLVFLVNGESFNREDEFDSYSAYDWVVIANGEFTPDGLK